MKKITFQIPEAEFNVFQAVLSYMRRMKKKPTLSANQAFPILLEEWSQAENRIEEMGEEIERLKRELADRVAFILEFTPNDDDD